MSTGRNIPTVSVADPEAKAAPAGCLHEGADICLCDDPDCGIWTCRDCGDSGLKQLERQCR